MFLEKLVWRPRRMYTCRVFISNHRRYFCSAWLHYQGPWQALAKRQAFMSSHMTKPTVMYMYCQNISGKRRTRNNIVTNYMSINAERLAGFISFVSNCKNASVTTLKTLHASRGIFWAAQITSVKTLHVRVHVYTCIRVTRHRIIIDKTSTHQLQFLQKFL